MTQSPSSAIHQLHSLPRYSKALPRPAARPPIVVLQSAACAASVGELQQPWVLHAEHPDFAQHLHQVLAQARVGSQLYILGDEAFIWRIQVQARSAGLEDDEITAQLALNGARQVYCVHCGLTQAAGPEPLLSCLGCNVQLEVRAHFSRRLGAYLAVCADPDQTAPGARR